ncbi:hypothetical protein FACS1894191_7510 [Clostridia bacterium]|nr:hypothetical protein FACS1894191_7510 [Clostridia bacterium]
MKIKCIAYAIFGIALVLSGTVTAFAADPGDSGAAQLSESPVLSDDTFSYKIEDSVIFPAKTNDSGNAPILKDVRAVEQGRQTLLVKTWDIPPDYDPEQLVEADFEKSGLHYKKAYLLQVSEDHDNQTRLASETVTVNHENREDAIASLQPILDYSIDGFTGQLTLQADAIVTESAGQRGYNYAVTDIRQYSGLERNDPASIPKTVNKNGVQLQLVDISWKQLAEGNYTATASYSGTAAGTAVTGYISTATYIGEVSKKVLDSVTGLGCISK